LNSKSFHELVPWCLRLSTEIFFPKSGGCGAYIFWKINFDEGLLKEAEELLKGWSLVGVSVPGTGDDGLEGRVNAC